MGVTVSKTKSLLMDVKVWNPSLIKIFQDVGNVNANLLWTAKLPPDDAINPSTDRLVGLFKACYLLFCSGFNALYNDNFSVVLKGFVKSHSIGLPFCCSKLIKYILNNILKTAKILKKPGENYSACFCTVSSVYFL